MLLIGFQRPHGQASCPSYKLPTMSHNIRKTILQTTNHESQYTKDERSILRPHAFLRKQEWWAAEDRRGTKMCLAIPARIVELKKDNAVVDAMGNRWRAKTTLLPEAKLGDLVLIHAGFAISLVDEEEAKKTWELLAQIANFEETPNKVSG